MSINGDKQNISKSYEDLNVLETGNKVKNEDSLNMGGILFNSKAREASSSSLKQRKTSVESKSQENEVNTYSKRIEANRSPKNALPENPQEIRKSFKESLNRAKMISGLGDNNSHEIMWTARLSKEVLEAMPQDEDVLALKQSFDQMETVDNHDRFIEEFLAQKNYDMDQLKREWDPKIDQFSKECEAESLEIQNLIDSNATDIQVRLSEMSEGIARMEQFKKKRADFMFEFEKQLHIISSREFQCQEPAIHIGILKERLEREGSVTFKSGQKDHFTIVQIVKGEDGRHTVSYFNTGYGSRYHCSSEDPAHKGKETDTKGLSKLRSVSYQNIKELKEKELSAIAELATESEGVDKFHQLMQNKIKEQESKDPKEEVVVVPGKRWKLQQQVGNCPFASTMAFAKEKLSPKNYLLYKKLIYKTTINELDRFQQYQKSTIEKDVFLSGDVEQMQESKHKLEEKLKKREDSPAYLLAKKQFECQKKPMEHLVAGTQYGNEGWYANPESSLVGTNKFIVDENRFIERKIEKANMRSANIEEVSFSPFKDHGYVQKGNCTAMTLSLSKKYLKKSQEEKTEQELKRLVEKQRSASDRSRKLQIAFNQIQIATEDNFQNPECKQDKMKALLQTMGMKVQKHCGTCTAKETREIYQTPPQGEPIKRKIAEQRDIEKFVENMSSDGVYVMRLIKPEKNAKGEEYGHTTVCIKQGDNFFFYDPNRGLHKTTNAQEGIREYLEHQFSTCNLVEADIYQVEELTSNEKKALRKQEILRQFDKGIEEDDLSIVNRTIEKNSPKHISIVKEAMGERNAPLRLLANQRIEEVKRDCKSDKFFNTFTKSNERSAPSTYGLLEDRNTYFQKKHSEPAFDRENLETLDPEYAQYAQQPPLVNAGNMPLEGTENEPTGGLTSNIKNILPPQQTSQNISLEGTEAGPTGGLTSNILPPQQTSQNIPTGLQTGLNAAPSNTQTQPQNIQTGMQTKILNFQAAPSNTQEAEEEIRERIKHTEREIETLTSFFYNMDKLELLENREQVGQLEEQVERLKFALMIEKENRSHRGSEFGMHGRIDPKLRSGIDKTLDNLDQAVNNCGEKLSQVSMRQEKYWELNPLTELEEA